MSPIKIPVWVAVLINANIVIGGAFFLSTGKIASADGILAPFAWLLCGLMLLPLVIVLARLSIHYPLAGGLYIYSKECLGATWGFISGWGYFIGAVAGNAAVIHGFSKYFQKMDGDHAFLHNFGIAGMRLDITLVLLFTIFNLFNIEFLERTQILFAILKTIPLLAIITALPFLFDVNNIVAFKLNWAGFFGTLPLVLFAYVGVEACCAIADKIEDGQRNAAKVILISFGLIMAIYTILQFILLCVHGDKNVNPFLTVLPMLTSNPCLLSWGNMVISIGLMSSFLAGFYGMFYFNNWNLYAIGKEKSIIFSKYLTMLNKNCTPWVCVLIQSFLVILFLLLIGKGYFLITMSDIATTMAYLLSTISFLTLGRSLTGVLALASCFVLIFITTSNLMRSGIYSALAFVLILGLGIVAHKVNEYLINKKI